MGWVRTRRESKAGLAFVELNDGSCFDNLQLVVPASLPDFPALVARLHPGTSLWAVGNLVASQGGKQPVEVQVEEMGIWGDSDPLAYPIAKQKMSYEHLREVTHLRPRTNTFSALARLRGALARAVHGFFGTGVFNGSTRPSSRPMTAKARARRSGSRPWTWLPWRVPARIPIFPRIFSASP
jgi:asparaginyl-tRNA synthetase